MKIHATCDALGNPTGFHLTPGQAHDLQGVDALLRRCWPIFRLFWLTKPTMPQERVLDLLENAEIRAVIPPKLNRLEQREYDEDTNLANHLEGMSHDAVNDYLRRSRNTARDVGEIAESLINNQPGSYLIVGDNAQDKRHVRVMELVEYQCSKNAHGLVKGIGVVNVVHSDGTDYDPIDFQV